MSAPDFDDLTVFRVCHLMNTLTVLADKREEINSVLGK